MEIAIASVEKCHAFMQFSHLHSHSHSELFVDAGLALESHSNARARHSIKCTVHPDTFVLLLLLLLSPGSFSPPFSIIIKLYWTFAVSWICGCHYSTDWIVKEPQCIHFVSQSVSLSVIRYSSTHTHTHTPLHISAFPSQSFSCCSWYFCRWRRQAQSQRCPVAPPTSRALITFYHISVKKYYFFRPPWLRSGASLFAIRLPSALLNII